jgi:hypothetical protein
MMGGGSRGERYHYLEGILQMSAYFIRQLGWVSRAEEQDSFGSKRSTSSRVWSALDRPKYSVEEPVSKLIGDFNKKLAAEALSWAQALEVTGSEDYYLWNLHVIALNGVVASKRVGLA